MYAWPRASSLPERRPQVRPDVLRARVGTVEAGVQVGAEATTVVLDRVRRGLGSAQEENIGNVEEGVCDVGGFFQHHQIVCKFVSNVIFIIHISTVQKTSKILQNLGRLRVHTMYKILLLPSLNTSIPTCSKF